MSARRIAVLAATTAAIALPVVSAPAATAAPAHATSASTMAKASDPCDREGPWKIHASAVNLHSKASSHSTVLGVMYKSHKFKVHSSTSRGSGWVHVTDKTTHVTGWASMKYVYPTVYTCLP
ncbi:SH3 domain-containing protein [Streptomyces decoyicus]|uniref:SH3 domain-containing protein n=1 Tax=Streptomyces decoyicus TaxID=249567 RepID=UPI003665EA4B